MFVIDSHHVLYFGAGFFGSLQKLTADVNDSNFFHDEVIQV